MENLDDFYLVLPSNSSMKYYDNTTTKFTTHLEREIKLHGSWSVGISEIHLPQTIIHLQSEETTFVFISNANDPTTKSTTWFRYGIYDHIDDLAAEINTFGSISEHQNFAKSNYVRGYWDFRRTCKCLEPHRTYFSRKIMQIFGLDESVTDETGLMLKQVLIIKLLMQFIRDVS